jgi:4-amino-4-deoxy-L-arabinose transferase-like glycosyltransferase
MALARLRWDERRLALAFGSVAAGAVIATLGDPGITCDEPLDVRPGRTYVTTLLKRGLGFFDAATVKRVFADNAEHPPLGRWLLGIASTLGEPFEHWLGGADAFSVHAGRLAPALAFALLVGLIVRESARRDGLPAGAAAGFSLLAMPRLFAHAHFAALDTFLCLFWVWSLLSAIRAMESRHPVRAMGLAGLIWALALLTKIHAWLLPAVVALAAVTRLKPARAVAALSAWAFVGLITYFAAWPWLWYDTLARFKGYLLGTSLHRLSLQVQYFGHFYSDRDVPWHYPWFYFAVTVPIGLHALGVLGVARTARNRLHTDFVWLLLAAIAIFLVLFSTRIAVYDGERLFLVTFPLWAMVIGRGFNEAWAWARSGAVRLAALLVLLAMQAYGTVSMHPFGLSYYNVLVGGLPGAERLGLELTYWGDTVDSVLLDALATRAQAGQIAALIPTLHDLQPLASTTNSLYEHKITLVSESSAPGAPWWVIYRRMAYWKPNVAALTRTTPVFARRRQGVWLSGIWPSTLTTEETELHRGKRK